MRGPGIRVALVLLVLLLAGISPLGAQDDDSPFPLTGVVASSTHSGIGIRADPPHVSAFHYDIGDFLCGLGNGSRFTAYEQRLVANGEVWYRVSVDAVTRTVSDEACPAVPFTGWLLASTQRGATVNVLERNVEIEPRADAAHGEAPAGDKIDGVEPEEHPSVFAILGKYLLLVIGTLLGVILVSMERARSLKSTDWLVPIVYLEMILLVVVNVVFMALLVDSKYVAGDTTGLAGGTDGPLFSLVKLFDAMPGGFLILGFAFTVLWMRFMAFTSE